MYGDREHFSLWVATSTIAFSASSGKNGIRTFISSANNFASWSFPPAHLPRPHFPWQMMSFPDSVQSQIFSSICLQIPSSTSMVLLREDEMVTRSRSKSGKFHFQSANGEESEIKMIPIKRLAATFIDRQSWLVLVDPQLNSPNLPACPRK